MANREYAPNAWDLAVCFGRFETIGVTSSLSDMSSERKSGDCARRLAGRLVRSLLTGSTCVSDESPRSGQAY